ncbi:RNA-directed DNA polymerase [Cereibacter sphaeroides]|uniref:RNA-directed DNA polymerase n=1 Tax=Cereibacter sphaeroides TaxID=1063 RepID=UPI000F51E6DD|nr:RNA-directed DNA polymerase [Cereibacter sphaeroides]
MYQLDLELKNVIFSTGQVLGFPVDVRTVLSQLQQDMRDDWYCDTLGYSDIFSDADYVTDVILKCLNGWGGTYLGDPRVVRPIPKKNYAERYSLETDFFDRFVYQAACSFLAPEIDRTLSHRVLSYRFNRDSEDAKYLFRNKINKWLDYEGLTCRFIQNRGALAATDVSNFFENVSSKQVIAALHSAIKRAEVSGYKKGQMLAAARLLESVFSRWTLNGEFGLPQNRDCSSFLSNVLLSRVDFDMQARGYDYYRYVDDIRVVCANEHEARRSLQILISLLREVGMNINSTKTAVIKFDSPESLIAEHFPSQNELVLAIASMWKSRSRRVFIRSIEYIVEILREALAKGDTQSRTFRFAVSRLSQLVEAKLFDVESEDADALLEYALQSLKDDAVSTDQLCKLILTLAPDDSFLREIGGILKSRDSCIHDWQNHKLWILLATHRYDEEALRDLAQDVLKGDPTTGEAAGVMIWLQSIGFLQPIEALIDIYSEKWPYQNQRYLFIAAAGLPADKHAKLYGRVPEKVLGTSRRSKSVFRDDGVAIAKREKPSFSALYEDIKDYS